MHVLTLNFHKYRLAGLESPLEILRYIPNLPPAFLTPSSKPDGASPLPRKLRCAQFRPPGSLRADLKRSVQLSGKEEDITEILHRGSAFGMHIDGMLPAQSIQGWEICSKPRKTSHSCALPAGGICFTTARVPPKNPTLNRPFVF
jgi:hypothetical protein